MAALIAVVVFRRNIGAELSPLPAMGVIRCGPATTLSTALAWFALLQEHRFLGLTLLGFFDIVNKRENRLDKQARRALPPSLEIHLKARVIRGVHLRVALVPTCTLPRR